MYQRRESNQHVGKTKISQLVLPGEGNSSVSSTKDNIIKSQKRLWLKNPKSTIKVLSKEASLDKMSPSHDSFPSNLTSAGKCISSKA